MIMKSLGTVLALLTLALSGTTLSAANWITDLNAAKEQAARENKAVLVNFTGSDWCGWCIKLKKEVFSQPEFDSYALKNLVLVEIDFPKRKALPKELQRANAALADKMKIGGYPTLVYLNSKGVEIGRGGYQPGGPRPFVKAIAKTTGLAADDRDSGPSPSRAKSKQVEDIPIFNGAPTAPPPRYTDLVLKNISGTKDRRFAILNNQTFAAGDTAKVKLHDGTVNVRCLEIRDSSVVVTIDGQSEQREIKLRAAR